MTLVKSWGRAKKTHSEVLSSVSFDISKNNLVVGSRLSYGDTCLNNNNILVDYRNNDSILSFDPEKGVLKAQAGITFDNLLKFLVSRGFFLPVTPGTKYITLGGAVANDIHGKNHHVDGTFGNWVRSLSLTRSDGHFTCSPRQNSDLFKATIGGLGLTGIIEWVEFKLVPIKSSFVRVKTTKFNSFEKFLEINANSLSSKYTVAWVDCLYKSQGEVRLRGHYMSGDPIEDNNLTIHKRPGLKTIPIEFPSFSLNKYTVKAFNWLYYNRQFRKQKTSIQHYDQFFYPLDGISKWNRIYGTGGLFQFQCVLPFTRVSDGMSEILETIASFGEGSFLSVLKTFGDKSSPGLLSFPREGITLALDFPNRGSKTMRLLNELYGIVQRFDGRVYPAKDQILNKELFEQFYSNYQEFSKYIDPSFSSDWWRRVRSTT